MESITYTKSQRFAVRIVNLCKYLKKQKREFIMAEQLLRCGTSIGANIAEAEYSISRKDFLSKMYIAYKECGETHYWLDVLHDTNYLRTKEYNSIYNDCIEIQKLLTSITKNTRTETTD